MPRQMPRNGRSASPKYARSASATSSASSASMAAPKHPTPGKTRISAPSTSAAVRTRDTSQPRSSKALTTLRTLPAP